MSAELSQVVAQSADAADLHAPVPTLLLELQTLLGTLTATVAARTNRGRSPFRPDADWSLRLGELAYGVYLLADQTGVDVGQAVANTARNVSSTARPAAPLASNDWPFDSD
ncbi:hypothetical protein [Jatrophihabitans sp.]|uniref:hypothetical protein n=1 Tax=Jatrophihabitans sp. TaxID=1932789 RepID=UPI0030C74F45|nr:hypothetical protein [Jatrophihabitans sp.]